MAQPVWVETRLRGDIVSLLEPTKQDDLQQEQVWVGVGGCYMQ